MRAPLQLVGWALGGWGWQIHTTGASLPPPPTPKPLASCSQQLQHSMAWTGLLQGKESRACVPAASPVEQYHHGTTQLWLLQEHRSQSHLPTVLLVKQWCSAAQLGWPGERSQNPSRAVVHCEARAVVKTEVPISPHPPSPHQAVCKAGIRRCH